MRKRKGALLRISIEIETTKKSLFYLLAQSVSVYPTSNVGPLVIEDRTLITVERAMTQQPPKPKPKPDPKPGPGKPGPGGR
jgi:hypothetical protein